MFGLLESCKLNNINFGEYIEDLLTRFLLGKQADESFSRGKMWYEQNIESKVLFIKIKLV